MALSHLLLRRLKCSKPPSICLLSQIPKPLDFSSLSAAPESPQESSSTPKPTSLSARMSFLFEQMDEIDKNREEKDQTLQRIRTWRESKKQKDSPSTDPAPDSSAGDSMDGLKLELEKSEAFLGKCDVKKEVELVHPWPEWIEFMERLLQQNYFDQRRKDEDRMMEGLGFDVSEAKMQEDKRLDFARDFKTVETAVVNFGRDRFDILRSLSRQDLQILVGYGCLSADKRVVFSSKMLRKHVHLDEGDVCSSCSLRNSCEKAYLLTNKEDEPRTIDVMRILLDYGFDPVAGSVANKSVLKNKSVKTVVRKLLHEVVKLSAVPIDPNLTPPIYTRPPPKVKQPPPPPKRRVGRNDIEMKKGDWLCQKCDFMNFAKNTVCLQCDAKRPKRQLLPGEWECPECNFLNYRRNTVCFHCEHKRPPDTYVVPESQFPEQRGPVNNRMEKIPSRRDVTDAWNFDFDDNESDGADVAAFEYADSKKLDEDFPPSYQAVDGNSRGHEDGFERSNRLPKGFEKEYTDSSFTKPGTGFNDFDEEDDDVESYELVAQNDMPKTPRIDFSELEADSDSDDVESTEDNWQARGKPKFPRNSRKQMDRKTFSGSEDTDDDLPVHPKWKSSHVANPKQQNRGRDALAFGSDNDSGSDYETARSMNKGNRRGSYGMDRGRGGRSNFKGSFSEGDSDDEMMRSNSRGNNRRGGSNVMGRGRGGRSNFNASFSGGDSDDEMMRPKSRGNRNEMGRGRGGRSNFNASFSGGDSDDEMMRPRSRGNRNEMGRGRGGGRSNFNASFSGGDSDDEMMRPKSRGNRNEMGRGRGGGRSNFKGGSFSDEDETMRSKSSRGNRRGGGSSGMDRGRGGRSNFKGDYDDERGGRNGQRRGGMTGGRNNDFDRSSGRKSSNSRGSREDSFNDRDGRSHKQGGSFNKRGGRSNNFDSRSESYVVDERLERPRNNVR